KPEVAGREVELFVVTRIVRDVHLAVLAGVSAPAVEHRGRVVIKPGRAALEQARDDRYVELRSEPREAFRSRTGNGLGEREVRRILVLTEVARAEQLRQRDEPGAAPGGLADETFGP